LKSIARLALAAALGFAHQTLMAADGPTAPYNEAVRIVDGKRLVEVAPFPKHMSLAVANFKRPDEQPPLVGDLRVIETPQGLMDCSGTLWFHPKACSPSTFGREKRLRTWIVMMDQRWFACGSRDSAKSCVPIIVDGVLRPIPSTRE